MRDVEGTSRGRVGVRVSSVRDNGATLHDAEAVLERGAADFVDELVVATELRIEDSGVATACCDKVFAAALHCESRDAVSVVLLGDEWEVGVVEQVAGILGHFDNGVNTAVQEAEGVDVED